MRINAPISILILLSQAGTRAQASSPTVVRRVLLHNRRSRRSTNSISNSLAFLSPFFKTSAASSWRGSSKFTMQAEPARAASPNSDSSTEDPAVGLRTFVEGNEDGPTIVFVHGWPDDHVVWDKQVAHLKDRYRCVTTDLPGFSGDDVGTEKWGYTIEEVVRRLERTVEAEGRGQPVLLVAHDFGCIYSFKFAEKRPDLVHKMVAMDVGGAMKPGPLAAFCIVSYQSWLLLAFLIGRRIGNWMAGRFARLIHAPNGRRIAKATSCYPYYHVIRSIIKNGPTNMMPDCPLIFIHGRAGIKKLMTFHSDRWLEKVAAKEGSKVVAIEEAAHWVMWDAPERVNSELDTFFETT